MKRWRTARVTVAPRLAGLVALVLALAWCAPLGATPAGQGARRVLVLDDIAPRIAPDLLEAFRIQLAASAEIVQGSPAPRGIDEGAKELERAKAQVVVWIDDRGAGPHLVALTASQPSRLVELGPSSPGDREVDRVLALKVSELLEADVVAPKQADADRVPTTRAFFDGRVGVSMGGTPSLSLSTLGLAVGPRWELPGVILEAHGTFAAQGEIRSISKVGEVDASLDYAGVGARALYRMPPFAVGPYGELGIEVLRARGHTADKHEGAAQLLSPTTTLGVEGRLRIVDHLELGLGVGAQIWWTRQRLELEGMPMLDFGRARLVGSLGAVALFP